MTKILITAATGNIGQHVLRELRTVGADFEVMSSSAAPGACAASFEDPTSLTRAFVGIDTLFLVLPLVPHKLQLAAHVAQAAKAAGVKHIVRSSGAGADPQSPFALPQLQGQVDALLADTGIATTFLRPAGFMQNYATFLADAVRSGKLQAPSGDAAQSLVDTRDIAAVAARIVLAPQAHAGKAYTLTGGVAQTDSERAAIFARVLGRPVSFEAVPADAARQGMLVAGYPPPVVEWLDSLNRLVALGHARGVSPDVANLLGRAPITFEQFVQDHAAVWRPA